MQDLMAVSYTSVASRPRDAGALDALLADAQAFNREVGVTGALLYDDGVFIQYFEGEPAAVERVYARILAASSHRNVQELARGPIAARQFEGWYMAFCHAPETVMQVIANAGWEDQIPVTRSGAEPNKGLGLLLYHWNRWLAGGRQPASPALSVTSRA